MLGRRSRVPVSRDQASDSAPEAALDASQQRRKKLLRGEIDQLSGHVAAARRYDPHLANRAIWAAELTLLSKRVDAADTVESLDAVEERFHHWEAAIDTDNHTVEEDVYASLMEVLVEVGSAQLRGLSPARTRLLSEIVELMGRCARAVDAEGTHPVVAVARVQADVARLEARLDEQGEQTAEALDALLGRYEEEKARLAGGTSLAGIYAYEELVDTHDDIAPRLEIPQRALQVDDFAMLRDALDGNRHLWLGALQAAREQARAVDDMLDAVTTMKQRGEPADTIVPGWKSAARRELNRLYDLTQAAPDEHLQRAFDELATDLQSALTMAVAAKERELSLGEQIGEAGIAAGQFVVGVGKAILGPLVEAGHQVADLAKVYAHFASYGLYEPELTSQIAAAAEQGATTADIIESMAIGIVKTPNRWLDAAKRGDFEALGEETANLYMLAKTTKGLASSAVRRTLRYARARTVAEAGWKGNIDAQTAFRMRKRAMQDGVVIEIRPVSQRVVELRQAGHRGKPVYLKMKTVKEIDLKLGAAADDLGKVGYFKPKLPADMNRYSPAKQRKIRAQYDKRMKEYEGLAPEVARLLEEGKITRSGNLIADPNGKPFTGDYDLFSITKPDMKTSLEPDYWKKMGPDVEHGAALEWNIVKSAEVNAFADIIMEVRPMGGQKLVRFNPDGSIAYAVFND